MSYRIIGILPKKKLAPSEKVTPSEGVKKELMFWMIRETQWSQSAERIWITFRVSL